MAGFNKRDVTNLQKIVAIFPKNKGKEARLPTPAARGPLSAVIGRGKAADNPLDRNAGGGIASPVKEGTSPDIAVNRTYHNTRQQMSSDGLLTVEYKNLKQITMFDADGLEVIFEFADEPGP